MGEQKKRRELFRNTLSYIGGLVFLAGLTLTVLSLVWGTFFGASSPYLGILTYMVFPAILGFGVALVFAGMFLESRRRKKAGSDEALPYPRLDLNNQKHRRNFTITVISLMFLVTILSALGYNAFHFTESITFCGKICHKVMEPEYSAYLHSPHARVTCVECHVGKGVSWYVKSKLSGAYQVWAVMSGHYPTPIPTPVRNLRPARETCEECHWPQKFYGAQMLQIPFYRYDEKNTSDQISLLVKTGGGTASLGQSTGIHWHMIIDNTIEFAATDERLQEIPYIKVTGAYGQVREYFSTDKAYDRAAVSKAVLHKVDCMDCHNRPTHIFVPPDRAIDYAIRSGAISPDIPYVKKVTYEEMTKSYPDNAAARKGIRDGVFAYYSKNYPDIYKTRMPDIERAVATVTDIYDRTVFPHMKVDWRTYPENIGHRNWPGCFRCHDGKHVSGDGKVLSKECTLCHTMPQRGPIEQLGSLPPISDESWHPFKLEGKHADMMCHECHSAGTRPSPDCSGCHGKQQVKDAPMSGMSCTDCHERPGSKQPVADCKACHDSLAGLHKKGGHADPACTDCHAPHGWAVTERASCLACHDDRKDHNAPNFCGECHDFRHSADVKASGGKR